MNNMKKKLLLAITFVTVSGMDVTAHERLSSGHVINIRPVHENWVEHRQVKKIRCQTIYKSDESRIHDVFLGSLIGSIIGNKVSDSPGFGSLGAVVGMGIAGSRHRHAERCQTTWHPERYTTRSLSHYEVSVVHRGRTISMRSQHPYLIGEHIHFAR